MKEMAESVIYQIEATLDDWLVTVGSRLQRTTTIEYLIKWRGYLLHGRMYMGTDDEHFGSKHGTKVLRRVPWSKEHE
jgi:hypothetical protein